MPIYHLSPLLEPFLRASGVPRQRGVPEPAVRLRTRDPVVRYLASYLAHVEGQHDLASVIIEPLAKSADDSTPVALAQQAVFADNDPIFPRGVARDMAKDLRERAARRDEELWGPSLWLALEQADRWLAAAG